MPIEVILAEDHSMVRQAIRILLENGEFYEIVGEAADGYAAIRLARELCPDVALLDLAMPRLNGLEAAREIHKESPKTNCLLLTAHSEEAYVRQALLAGIRGYVMKSQASSDLVQAIDAVIQGRIYLSPPISQTVLNARFNKNGFPRSLLSLRECRVLQLIAEGKTAKEIAGVLDLSMRAAESHRTRIMEKLGVRGTASLVRYAVRRGLVEL